MEKQNHTKLLFCRPRERIVDELRERGLASGTFLEIGVCRGDFSEHLLKYTECTELILVDPWDEQDTKVYDETHHNHSNNYDFTMERLAEQRDVGRVRVLREQSTTAAAKIPPASLDFIYIDGNHSYDAVRDDLNNLWGKLRPGGVMMGDDYHVKPIEPLHFHGHDPYVFGVKKAVDEFAVQRGLSVDIRWTANWSYGFPGGIRVRARNWMIVKPLA